MLRSLPLLMGLFGLPHAALAADVAVAPLIQDGRVSTKAHDALDRVLVDAVPALGEWDRVVTLGEVPASLNPVCLELAGCLSRIAQTAGTTHLIAGMVSSRDGAYQLDLVMSEERQITARHQVQLSTDPAELEQGMRAAVGALLGVQVLAPGTEAAFDFEQEPATPQPPAAAQREPRVALAGRAGWSGYQTLDFLGMGGEVRLRVSQRVHLVAGAELYVVNRRLIEEDGSEVRRLNGMVPVNLGAIYRANLGAVAPYVGGDAIVAKYNQNTPVPSIGARARAGADVRIRPQVSLNLDLSAGLWGAGRWNRIEEGVQRVGLLPGARAGVVVAF